jgi:glycosyltransferase involved in cell wall biosynthesis
MSAPPAVDIVIDNHDYGRFLGAAIDSALAQEHGDVRVIVVDDGSTDDSRAVIAGYGDRVEAVLKENGGQASALNAGYARTRGDVVLFLDADDVLLPGAAAAAARVFAARPETVKVQFRMEIADAAGRRTGTPHPPREVALPSGDLRRAELTFPFDLTWMATSANAFSRRALERILPIPEARFARCADWYLQHLVALLGPVVSLDEVHALYRLHGGNAYGSAAASLDLERVRRSVRFAAVTRPELVRLAGELGLPRPGGPVLSMSDLGNRLISLRLAPAQHPLRGDRVARLAAGGLVAAARRFDVARRRRLAFAGWFAAMAVAPRPAAARIAEWFLFPERRPGR